MSQALCGAAPLYGEFSPISQLRPWQLQQVREMYKELLEFEMPFTPHAEEYIRENMEQSIDELLMAVKDVYILQGPGPQELVGFFSVNHGEPCEINALYLREEYRNQNYGSVMITRFAQLRKYDAIKVNCFDLNVIAMRFYRKNGFVFRPQMKGHPVQHGIKPPLFRDA